MATGGNRVYRARKFQTSSTRQQDTFKTNDGASLLVSRAYCMQSVRTRLGDYSALRGDISSISGKHNYALVLLDQICTWRSINVQNNMMAPIVGTSLYQMINNKYNNDLHEFRILLHKRYNFGEYMVLVTYRWVR